MNNQELKHMDKQAYIDLLGTPDRIDNNYMFYMVSQKRIGLWPLHTKTLVIKMSNDSTENSVLIHE